MQIVKICLQGRPELSYCIVNDMPDEDIDPLSVWPSEGVILTKLDQGYIVTTQDIPKILFSIRALSGYLCSPNLVSDCHVGHLVSI